MRKKLACIAGTFCSAAALAMPVNAPSQITLDGAHASAEKVAGAKEQEKLVTCVREAMPKGNVMERSLRGQDGLDGAPVGLSFNMAAEGSAMVERNRASAGAVPLVGTVQYQVEAAVSEYKSTFYPKSLMLGVQVQDPVYGVGHASAYIEYHTMKDGQASLNFDAGMKSAQTGTDNGKSAYNSAEMVVTSIGRRVSDCLKR